MSQNFLQNYSEIMKALEYASKIHKHQKRSFSNEPYINHPIRVANNPEVIKHGPNAIIVALLHDSIEDAEYPEESETFIKQNFSDEIYTAVKLLTHNRLELSYEEYINNILDSNNKLAIVVKYSDSLDNSTPTSSMDSKWIERCKLYKKRSDKYLEYLNCLSEKGNT